MQPIPGPQPHTEFFFLIFPFFFLRCLSLELSLLRLVQLVFSSRRGVTVGYTVRAEVTAQGSLKQAALFTQWLSGPPAAACWWKPHSPGTRIQKPSLWLKTKCKASFLGLHSENHLAI